MAKSKKEETSKKVEAPKEAKINHPSQDLMKEMFLAAQSAASDFHNEIRKWEDLITPAASEPDPDDIEQTRSQINLKHIRKLLEWRYPVLEQAFLAKKDLYNPSGRDAHDTGLAEFHKTILNYQLNNEMDKLNIITRAVRAYVNHATVVGYLGWKHKKEKTLVINPVFRYDFVAEDSPMFEVLEKEYIEILSILAETPSRKSNLPAHMVEGARYYEKYKQVKEVIITDYTQTLSEEDMLVANHPTIDIISIFDVFGAPECKTNLEDSPYVFYKYPEYIYELEDNEKYNTKAIDWETVGSISNTFVISTEDGLVKGDKRKQVEVIEYWGMHDITGTGKLEQCIVTWVDGHVLETKRNPFPDKKHAFYSAAYLPSASMDTFFGESDAMLLEDNQSILSAMHRGFVDIHGNSAYGQKGVAKDILDPVNRDKFLRGENFEYDANTVDPNALFETFQFPEISASAIGYVNMLNAESESLTGIKAFNEGISGSSYGDTAAGVKGILSATALRETSIITRLSEMFVKMGKRTMFLNTLYLDNEKITQLTGKDGLLIKSVMNPLIDVKLHLSNQAEDNLKAQEMSFMLQTMGNTIDPTLATEMLKEIAELRNMHSLRNKLDAFVATPPEPSEAEKEIQALQIALLKAQIANEESKARKGVTDAALNEAKIPNEQAKAGKTQAEASQLDIENERLASGQETKDKISIISAQAESNISAAVIKQKKLRGDDSNVSSIQ